MKFKVKYKFRDESSPEPYEGIESEASWFLIDQRGNFYSHGPIEPIKPIKDGTYEELIPLIKIGEEYLSVKEIEERIK